MLKPSDIGLPPKFVDWRPGQWECIETTMETDKRFIACSFPTGGGKSVYGVSCATLDGSRAVYLTSTKGLQKQLNDDFGSMGLTDIKGRGNYSCSMSRSHLSCTEGRILGCRDSECEYNLRRQEFLESKLCSTNYSYYLSSVMHSEGVGNVGQLLLDEAHNAIQELDSAIEIRLKHADYYHVYDAINGFPPYKSSELAEWRTWAKYSLPKAQTFLTRLKLSNNHRWLNLTDSFVMSLGRLAQVSESWILDNTRSEETLISPLWPTDYAEKYLFRGVPRVILKSATMVPKTLDLLGVPRDEVLFITQDNTFPAHRAPIYLFGDSRVDHKMTDGDWLSTMGIMDTFIKRRKDRKGIIHCVSYAYQERILKTSDWSHTMIAPRRASEFQEKLEEFRSRTDPCIFLSPSVTTGYDFPYQACEFNIILKVPFIDGRSPVMKARSEKDPEYLPYLTAQILVQECGRAMRAPDDQCENLILDRHARWFLMPQEKKGYRHLVPSWFMNQVQYTKSQPDPLPKL